MIEEQKQIRIDIYNTSFLAGRETLYSTPSIPSTSRILESKSILSLTKIIEEIIKIYEIK